MDIECNKYCCSDLWNFDGFDQIYNQTGQINKISIANAKQINRICGCNEDIICLFEKENNKVCFVTKNSKSNSIKLLKDNICDVLYNQNRLYVLEYVKNQIIIYNINSPYSPRILNTFAITLPNRITLTENSSMCFYKNIYDGFLIIYTDKFHILQLKFIDNGHNYECIYNKSLDIRNIKAFTIDETNNSLLVIHVNNSIKEYDIRTGLQIGDFSDEENYYKHEAMNYFNSKILNPVDIVVYRLCDHSRYYEANIKNKTKYLSDGEKHRLILVSDAGDKCIKKISEYPKLIGFHSDVIRYINILFGNNPALKNYILTSTYGKTNADLYDINLEYPGKIAVIPDIGVLIVVDEKYPAVYTIDNRFKNVQKVIEGTCMKNTYSP